MNGSDVYALGDRRELFVDDFFIDRLDGDVTKKLHSPEPDNVILTLDEPHETSNDAGCAFNSLLYDGKRYIYYYRAHGRFPTPDDPGTINDLAWILAASPVESFRDGKTAFKLAERLSKIEGDTIQSLDALGTAYAAIGNYKMGADRLERALAMAKAEKAEELIGPLTMRMNFFKKGRVYSDETIGSDR